MHQRMSIAVPMFIFALVLPLLIYGTADAAVMRALIQTPCIAPGPCPVKSGPYCSNGSAPRPATAAEATGDLKAGDMVCEITGAPQTPQQPGAGGCRPGERPATADDAVVKNGQLKEGTCYNPKDAVIGENQEQAKQYLRSILCPPDRDNYGGLGPDGTIQRLDSKFAVCAASFLKKAMDGGRVCIKEGARSVEKQNEYARRPIVACKYGARCEHPRGVAIDVNVVGQSGCAAYQRLFNLAPQFGLKFYLGCKDAYHFVPAKGGCSAGGNVPADSPLPPTFYDYPQYIQGSTPPPFSTPLTTMQPPPPPPQQQCQPRYQCSGNTLMHIDASCNQQPYQQCPGGCNGEMCVANVPQTPQQTAGQQMPTGGTQPTNGTQPTGGTGGTQPQSSASSGSQNTSPLPTPAQVPDLLNSSLLSRYDGVTLPTSSALSLKKPTTSPFEIIARVAEEPTSTKANAADTGEPIDIASTLLNPDLRNIRQAAGEMPLEDALRDEEPKERLATGSVAVLRPAPQETFTSADLQYSPVVPTGTPPSASNSFALRILANLRSILEWALRYLRSFAQGPLQPPVFQPQILIGD